MDKKNITPEQNQPINRITSGQLPAELAELSEEILHSEAIAPALEALEASVEAASAFPPIPPMMCFCR